MSVLRSPGSPLRTTDTGLSLHQVTFQGGLLVRRGPDFGAEKTSITIPKNTVFASVESVEKSDGSRFLHLTADYDGGWVVARKQQIVTAETLSTARTLNGPFYYKVVHPSGARFAISADVSASANRHEVTHPLGRVLIAKDKRMEAGSHVAVVQLDQGMGWLFENARTGEVLDRLGEEPIVVPIDGAEMCSVLDSSEPHDQWYRVVYKGGIRLRSGPSMTQLLDISLPMGCFVKTSRRVNSALIADQSFDFLDLSSSTTAHAPLSFSLGSPEAGETNFLLLESCVGARARVVANGCWVFDRARGQVALEATLQPKTEQFLPDKPCFLLVIFPGGISVRTGPHLASPKLANAPQVGYLDVCEIRGTIATHDGDEEFGLVSSGAGWLPLFSKGRAIACKIDERPVVEPGTYEYTLPKEGVAGRVCAMPYTSSILGTRYTMSPVELAAVTQSLVARGIRPGGVVRCTNLVTFPKAKKRFLILADSGDWKEGVRPPLWVEVSADVAVSKRTSTSNSMYHTI